MTTTHNVQDLLSLAAFHSDVQGCLNALALGADINRVDHNGRSPLARACMNQPTVETVQILLDAGANVAFVDRQDGQTALHSACRYGHTHIVPLLIARGSDPTKHDANGRTPMKLTVRFARKLTCE